MENASKALIISGSILIAIMIVSIGIFIFNKMGGSAKKAANMDEQEIAEFNSKITPYIGNVISTNLAAVKAKDATKSLTITYPISDTANASISIEDNATAVKYNPSNAPKRVQTGAGKFYTIEAVNGEDGLIETITVTQN